MYQEEAMTPLEEGNNDSKKIGIQLRYDYCDYSTFPRPKSLRCAIIFQ